MQILWYYLLIYQKFLLILFIFSVVSVSLHFCVFKFLTKLFFLKFLIYKIYYRIQYYHTLLRLFCDIIILVSKDDKYSKRWHIQEGCFFARKEKMPSGERVILLQEKSKTSRERVKLFEKYHFLFSNMPYFRIFTLLLWVKQSQDYGKSIRKNLYIQTIACNLFYLFIKRILMVKN